MLQDAVGQQAVSRITSHSLGTGAAASLPIASASYGNLRAHVSRARCASTLRVLTLDRACAPVTWQ